MLREKSIVPRKAYEPCCQGPGRRSGGGSGSLCLLCNGLWCHREKTLPAWLLKTAEFSSKVSVRTLQMDIVQYHGDAGNLQPLKKSGRAMQLLPCCRAGLNHKHSRIDDAREILGVC